LIIFYLSIFASFFLRFFVIFNKLFIQKKKNETIFVSKNIGKGKPKLVE